MRNRADEGVAPQRCRPTPGAWSQSQGLRRGKTLQGRVNAAEGGGKGGSLARQGRIRSHRSRPKGWSPRPPAQQRSSSRVTATQGVSARPRISRSAHRAWREVLCWRHASTPKPPSAGRPGSAHPATLLKAVVVTEGASPRPTSLVVVRSIPWRTAAGGRPVNSAW